MRAPFFLLVTAILIGGCSSKPLVLHTKEGTPLASYTEDEKSCKEVGLEAMNNFGKDGAQPAAQGAYVYTDPKYGAAPAVAGQGAASLASGYERGLAQGAAFSAAYDKCFATKGYKRVQLTEAEQGAYNSLSSDAQKDQMGRWVSGQERPENAR